MSLVAVKMPRAEGLAHGHIVSLNPHYPPCEVGAGIIAILQLRTRRHMGLSNLLRLTRPAVTELR